MLFSSVLTRSFRFANLPKCRRLHTCSVSLSYDHSFHTQTSSQSPTHTPRIGPTSFYESHLIEKYSSQPVTPVTLEELIRYGSSASSKSYLVQNAQFLQKELPIRLGKRVKAMQNLPYIVGTNPHIYEIYKLYLDSFDAIRGFEKVKDAETEEKFTQMLEELVEAHGEVIPKLAQGFLESRKYISPHDLRTFLDRLIHARIGIRVLAEHHIALHHQAPDYIGIICTALSPADLVKSCLTYVQELCDINYGSSPEVVLDGQLDTKFTYIPVHLEYMVTELLKNSMRATVEYSKRVGRTEHPNVRITISQGVDDIVIRFRDQGGGVPYDQINHVFDYSYTTVPSEEEEDGSSESIFSYQSKIALQQGVGGPMAGLGFGLGTSRVYSKYFGGSLNLISLYGYGCDVFLKLKNIGSKTNVTI
ncbi:branched-chain alpha-ketoacid dehydrogenase [Paraphysoderma sedebokerense]|nr:branched-chain alpha-ketoacid dehydrogenase [Paraphysoderma sedebokerense]